MEPNEGQENQQSKQIEADPDNGISEWSGFDELLSQITPTDIKDIIEKYSKYKQRQIALQLIEAKIRAKIACQYQWIRFVVILASCGIVGALIYCGKFESSAALFFGGIIAYLFGKEPK